MNAFEIAQRLEQEGLTEIEEVLVENDKVILEFFYDFDREELSAARAYANEESDLEEDSNEWKAEWYIPYLLDIAKDNIENVIEEIDDDFEVSGVFQEVKIDGNNNDYIKFVAVFCTDDCDEDLEEILSDYL